MAPAARLAETWMAMLPARGGMRSRGHRRPIRKIRGVNAAHTYHGGTSDRTTRHNARLWPFCAKNISVSKTERSAGTVQIARTTGQPSIAPRYTCAHGPSSKYWVSRGKGRRTRPHSIGLGSFPDSFSVLRG